MVHSDDWIEYKKLILDRLNDLSKLEEEMVSIKVQLAVLSTKVVVITASVAVGMSAIVSAIMNHFIKGV